MQRITIKGTLSPQLGNAGVRINFTGEAKYEGSHANDTLRLSGLDINNLLTATKLTFPNESGEFNVSGHGSPKGDVHIVVEIPDVIVEIREPDPKDRKRKPK